MSDEDTEKVEKRNSIEHVNDRDPVAVKLNPKKTSLSRKSNNSVKTNRQNDLTSDIRNYFNCKKQKSE